MSRELRVLQGAILTHLADHPEDAAMVVETAISGMREAVIKLQREAGAARQGVTAAILLTQPRVDERTRTAAAQLVMKAMGDPSCELERKFAEINRQKDQS